MNGSLADSAFEYASAGWEVFPLHPWDCRCVRFRRPGCGLQERDRGKVPLTVHGVLDASSNVAQVTEWWSRWPNANIGLRVPLGVVVLDIDPRSGGHETWHRLIAANGAAPTRTAISGRGDGGQHRYYSHPGGTLRDSIGAGIDVKTNKGYVVAPPSIHAASGLPYRWENATAPIERLPLWLVNVLREAPTVPANSGRARLGSRAPRGTALSSLASFGDSIADWYTTNHTWCDVLLPFGWKRLDDYDGDEDGSQWRHPTATSEWSATVKHGCLFVYSPNTPFAVTGANSPRGYTRFAAFALLNHRGDMRAAAAAARAMKDST